MCLPKFPGERPLLCSAKVSLLQAEITIRPHYDLGEIQLWTFHHPNKISISQAFWSLERVISHHALDTDIQDYILQSLVSLVILSQFPCAQSAPGHWPGLGISPDPGISSRWYSLWSPLGIHPSKFFLTVLSLTIITFQPILGTNWTPKGKQERCLR